MRIRQLVAAVAGMTGGFAGAGFVHAQVDNLAILVDRTNASGTSSLGATAYSPLTDTAYTSTFGAGMGLRSITNVGGGTQVSNVLVSESQLQMFYRDGE